MVRDGNSICSIHNNDEVYEEKQSGSISNTCGAKEMHHQVLEDYLLTQLLEIQQPPEVQALQRYCKEIKRHKNEQ